MIAKIKLVAEYNDVIDFCLRNKNKVKKVFPKLNWAKIKDGDTEEANFNVGCDYDFIKKVLKQDKKKQYWIRYDEEGNGGNGYFEIWEIKPSK